MMDEEKRHRASYGGTGPSGKRRGMTGKYNRKVQQGHGYRPRKSSNTTGSTTGKQMDVKMQENTIKQNMPAPIQVTKMQAGTRAEMASILKNEIMPGRKLDPVESTERGKELRKTIKRSAMGEWDVISNRQAPLQILEAQEKDRIQSLLDIRHDRMCSSPFAFFRGSAAIMAYDLASLPSTDLMVQACGDAHIGNFGVFSSGEHRLIFDINDFDETFQAPWEWDVKRLCASIEICGRDRGFSKEKRQEAVASAARSYCDAMKKFASMGTMDVWYSHLDIEQLRRDHAKDLPESTGKMLEEVAESASGKNSMWAVHKWTETVDGKLRIRSIPPLLVPFRDLKEGQTDPQTVKRFLKLAMEEYRLSLPHEMRALLDQYSPVDIGHKVVGVGSVGMRSFIVVLEGNAPSDPLVLQVKEAGDSVLAPYVAGTEEAHDRRVVKIPTMQEVSGLLDHLMKDNGKRVVQGQKAIQTAGDVMLGWMHVPDMAGKARDFYVRQLYNNKGSIDLGSISSRDLTWLSGICGWTLAHAHARTGNRFAIDGYLGGGKKFTEAMTEFAARYADQNAADYAVYVEKYGKKSKEEEPKKLAKA